MLATIRDEIVEKCQLFEFIQICDILIKCLHSKSDRFVFAFSFIVDFNV